MKRWLWLPVGLACVGVVAWLGVARGQDEAYRRYSAAKYEGLVSGEWLYSFHTQGMLTPEGRSFTDYAFGPGRLELACCGPKGEASALWVVSGQALLDEHQRIQKLRDQGDWRRLTPEEREVLFRSWQESPAAPRLLWTAPPGVTLRGPIRWIPNGDTVLVRAYQGEVRDLVAVDYVTGEATWLTHDAQVEDAAWSPSGKMLAYVTRDQDARALWLRSFPAGEPRKQGEGGYDLRWSPEGGMLRWQAPVSETKWSAREWDAATDAVSEGGERPARPEGTIWSPDGKRCAWLRAGEVVIASRARESGEEVPLPGLSPKRLLGWSPDSSLLAVLGAGDYLYLVNAIPPGQGICVATEDSDPDTASLAYYSRERAILARETPLALEAGDPTWSSDGRWLVYASLATPQELISSHPPVEKATPGRLLMLNVTRRRVAWHEKLPPKIERSVVTRNAKNCAIALNMYLTDWDRFPTSNGQAEMLAAIEDYVRNNGVFMRPGSKDEVVVRWVFDPTKSLGDIEDAAREEAVIIDYHPDFYVVGYVDGHVRAFDKKKP